MYLQNHEVYCFSKIINLNSSKPQNNHDEKRFACSERLHLFNSQKLLHFYVLLHCILCNISLIIGLHPWNEILENLIIIHLLLLIHELLIWSKTFSNLKFLEKIKVTLSQIQSTFVNWCFLGLKDEFFYSNPKRKTRTMTFPVDTIQLHYFGAEQFASTHYFDLIQSLNGRPTFHSQ